MTVGLPPAAAGQEPSADPVSVACASPDGPPPGGSWCSDVARAAQAAQGDVALLAAGGLDLPGAVSTLGRRVGSSPRLSMAVRFTGVRFVAPDVAAPTSPAAARTGLGVGLGGTFAIGLLPGFTPKPTVGGLLSVDVLATGDVLWAPGGLGHDGTRLAYGLGLRIGVFRESFTLPGVSLTVAQRWVPTVRLVDLWAGGPPLEMDVSTTSLRAVVGKDLWGLGWSGGVGWDRSSSGGSVPRSDGTTGDFSGLDNSRGLLFAGVSWSYFLIQLSGELGWASGWSGDPAAAGAYDPGSGRWFGGLSVRLIY